MFIKRTVLALCLIVLVLGLVTACNESTPVSPTVAPQPTMTPMLPETTPEQLSGSPADDNWLIRVLNGGTPAPGEPSPQAVSTPSASQAVTTSPADDNWLIRALHGGQ